jgi:KDO2-lipid IV(A) lauroyltransferase
LLEGATRASDHLPDWALRRALAAAAGLVRRGSSGKLALENLRAALGDELSPRELAGLQRGVFRHAARLAEEWLRLAGRAGRDVAGDAGAFIDELVELDDSIERLRNELDRGRGVLVVTAHLGNWELLAARLHRLGLQGAVVGRRRPNDPSADWFERMRSGYGVRTLSQDASPRPILEVLRAGGVIGMLCDLEVRRLDGEFVPFFGRQALFMTAPAALARAQGIPLVPVRCTGIGDGRYRLHVEAPLALRDDLPRREAARDLVQRLAETYEKWIREAPREWAWHQNRWRTREGEYDVVPLAERRRRMRVGREAES